MQPQTVIKAQNSSLVYTASATCKFSKPYHHAALINFVDRKLIKKISIQHRNTKAPKHPPLQSPYTCVYGRRWTFDTTLSICNPKQNQHYNTQNRIKSNYILKTPSITNIPEQTLRHITSLKKKYNNNNSKQNKIELNKTHTQNIKTPTIITSKTHPTSKNLHTQIHRKKRRNTKHNPSQRKTNTKTTNTSIYPTKRSTNQFKRVITKTYRYKKHKPHTNIHKLRSLPQTNTYEIKNKHINQTNIKHNKIKSNILQEILLTHKHNKNLNTKTTHQYNKTILQPTGLSIATS